MTRHYRITATGHHDDHQFDTEDPQQALDTLHQWTFEATAYLDTDEEAARYAWVYRVSPIDLDGITVEVRGYQIAVTVSDPDAPVPARYLHPAALASGSPQVHARLALTELVGPTHPTIAARVAEHGALATLAWLTDHDDAAWLRNGMPYRHPTTIDTTAILDYAARHGFCYLTPEDAGWPLRLPHPVYEVAGGAFTIPLGLWVHGTRRLDLLATDGGIAVVGGENPGDSCGELAYRCAHALTTQRVAVCAGLSGTGAAAHRGAALAAEAGSTTRSVVVLPTGPGGRLNLTQCQRLAASAEHAAVVSCWRIDYTDLRQAGTADRQDMLAAAMCGQLLQICGTDAPWQLAPARLAAALHHQVVAIPGALESPGTRGPHRLIAEGTAGLVTDASDPLGLGHEPARAHAGRASVVEADPGLDHDRLCGCGGRGVHGIDHTD